MSYTLAPSDDPRPRASGHEGYDLILAGRLTGVLGRDSGGRWYVHFAGHGVKVTPGRHVTGRKAVIALLRDRRDQRSRIRPGSDGLTGLQRDILAFEAAHAAARRAKDSLIYARFQILPGDYYRILGGMFADETVRRAAMEHDPVTAGRLWRRIQRRAALRSEWLSTPGGGAGPAAGDQLMAVAFCGHAAAVGAVSDGSPAEPRHR